MRKGWKVLAGVLGGAMLVCSGYEGVPVRAEEGGAVSAEAQSEKPAIQKATDLKWNEKGQGIFTNPNGRCEVVAYVYGPNGKAMPYKPNGLIPGGEIVFDLYHYMSESGTYTFEVYLKNNSGSVTSERSEAFEYVKPDIKLPMPVVSVTKEGVVSCSLPENEGAGYVLGTDYGFNCELVLDGQWVVAQRGTNESTVDFGKWMQPGKSYSVSVCTISRDITKYVDSDKTGLIPVNPEAEAPKEEAPKQEVVEESGWQPTEEDMKMYSAYGLDEIVFTPDAGNTYEVTIENSIQGLMCFASFEAARGDYTIARTYNIYPSERGKVSQMEDKARITMTIPEVLWADGRSFRMICVTENGRPIVLEDLDSNAETITFETNAYYAFALTYRDGAKGRAKTR